MESNNKTSNNKIRKRVAKLVIWVFSNTLWSIITYIIPFPLLIPLVMNIYTSIANHTFNITINLLYLFVLFILVEMIFVIINIKVKKSNKKNEDSTKDVKDIIDKNSAEQCYKEQDYYFEEYNKHLTVYKNGNGIIINSFTLVVNDINAISKFKRELKIHDSKKNTEFPKLRDMKRTKLSDRFSSFGFWCKCIDNKDLISSIEEKYWTDDDDDSDNIARVDKKDLKWIFKMNPSSIESGKPYKIVYVISIPGMFPISNGRFSENEANIRGTHGNFQSQFTVVHKIKKFIYTVSFENGLDLYKNPMGTIKVSGKEKNLHFTHDNNIIYDKYIFNIDDPESQSVINIEWKFKEIFKRNTGGNNYGKRKRN